MKLSDRIKRLIAVAEDSTDAELDLLMELLEERRIEEDVTEVEKKAYSAKPKCGRPVKTKIGRTLKYSNKQIVKAVKLRKQGFSKLEVSKRTGVKEGSLTNTKWLRQQFENIQKKQR